MPPPPIFRSVPTVPVLFRLEPVVPIERTLHGVVTHRRRPLRHRRLDLFWQLKRGPFLAGFDAGLYDWSMP